MARPIWTGAISFGLLQVPVQLMSGERRHDLHFRLLDSRDKNPIRYERVNSETGEEVPWKDIVKAYEYKKGDFVVLSDDELEKTSAEATQTIDIEAFVKLDQIPPMYFEKPYYLVPVKKAEKGYVLLRETLRESQYAGLAKVVIRTRQHLAVLLAVNDALVLNLIRFEQEIIGADEYNLPDRKPKDYRIAPKEMQMAKQLIDSMVVDWEPSQYTDETRARLRELIESRTKKSGRKTKAPPAEKEVASSNVVDFMSVLKKSLDTNRRTPAATTVKKKTTAASKAKPAKKRRAS